MHIHPAVMPGSSFARSLKMTSTPVDQSSPPVFSLLIYDLTRSMSSIISPRLLAGYRSVVKSISAGQARASSTATGSSSKLSPLRYHIVSEPLPYLTGLKLQHDIIDRRLKLKSKGEQTDDIVLLLGMTPPSKNGDRWRES
jgi:hypothetical protein